MAPVREAATSAERILKSDFGSGLGVSRVDGTATSEGDDEPGADPPDECDHGRTHPPASRRPPEDDENFVFVTDGIEAAVAQAKELAGDKNVAVNGGQMARQCLEAALLDEVGVELVPVVLGGGRSCSPTSALRPCSSRAPVAVVEGTGVTHLRYRVKK